MACSLTPRRLGALIACSPPLAPLCTSFGRTLERPSTSASAVAIAFLLLLVGPIAIYQYYNVRQLEA